MREILHTLILSKHAHRRMRNRGITMADAEYVYAYGTLIYQQGVMFCVLRRHDIPETDRSTQQYCRLAGTVLILRNGVLLTAYRNPESHRAISRKLKYWMSPEERRERRERPRWSLAA